MRRFYAPLAALSVLFLLGALRPAAAQGAPAATAAFSEAQVQLWEAAIAGDTAAIVRALDAGADVNALDTRRSPNGRRALNWAALGNHTDALRVLLAHGAELEGTNASGFTALHHAAEAGALEAARFLVHAGADPEHQNLNGDRPVETARAHGRREVAWLLMWAARER